MKITRVTCSVFVLLLFLVALAFSASTSTARAAPAHVVKLKFNGNSATALFDNVVGSVETAVVVDGSISNNGSEVADIFIGQFDTSANTTLFFAQGSTSSPDFQVSDKLDSASLSATIPVFDEVSSTTFNVSVSATWTGSGPLSIGISINHFHSKGFTVNSHFMGKTRNATASGTVLLGSTNLTPTPATLANIGSFNSAEVDITQP